MHFGLMQLLREDINYKSKLNLYQIFLFFIIGGICEKNGFKISHIFRGGNAYVHKFFNLSVFIEDNFNCIL